MKLIDLFDILYSDSNIQTKYSHFIDNFECNNLLNTPKKLSRQFVLIISNNIVINKTYNKLKIEFSNIDNNNISNNLILDTLNKLQHIINNSLLDEDSEILIEDIDSYTDELEQSEECECQEGEECECQEGEEGEECECQEGEEIMLPEKVEDDIKTILKKKEYLQIHVLQKKYGDNLKLKYLTTFLFNDTLNIPEELDINHEKFGKYDDEINLDNLFSIQDYYNNSYKDFNDYKDIYDYLENYDIIDNYLINNLSKILSGFYFNFNDIRFQIILKLIILTNIGDHGTIIKNISYKQFSKNNSITNYFVYNENNTDFFETLLFNNMHISCDVCNTNISESSQKLYYHNDYGGDLCDNCYNNKKEQFNERIKYIKKRILMVGRIELFKTDLKMTIKILKKKKFKIKKNNRYLLLEKMNKNLIKEPNEENICKICYNVLCQDIYVGSECGHCFHKSCIEQCDKCQICRKETIFIKLFL